MPNSVIPLCVVSPSVIYESHVDGHNPYGTSQPSKLLEVVDVIFPKPLPVSNWESAWCLTVAHEKR